MPNDDDSPAIHPFVHRLVSLSCTLKLIGFVGCNVSKHTAHIFSPFVVFPSFSFSILWLFSILSMFYCPVYCRLRYIESFHYNVRSCVVECFPCACNLRKWRQWQFVAIAKTGRDKNLYTTNSKKRILFFSSFVIQCFFGTKWQRVSWNCIFTQRTTIRWVFAYPAPNASKRDFGDKR